jgi:endonuclease/exonuclease/phosphatase family metal-dependent hydrolase
VDGNEYVAASVHLGLEPTQRLRHAAEVVERLSAYSLPVVLGADANEPPGSPAWELLAAHWPAAPAVGNTFPSKQARQRIDAVFTDLEVASAAVIGGPDVERASDHHPILVETKA